MKYYLKIPKNITMKNFEKIKDKFKKLGYPTNLDFFSIKSGYIYIYSINSKEINQYCCEPEFFSWIKKGFYKKIKLDNFFKLNTKIDENPK